jgi:hypothetical protein
MKPNSIWANLQSALPGSLLGRVARFGGAAGQGRQIACLGFVSKLLSAGCLCASLFVASGCERPHIHGAAPSEELVAEFRKTLSAGASAEEAGGEEKVAGTGWATLTGSFVLEDGAPLPVDKMLDITKDPAVCKPGGADVSSGTFVVDPASRGIKNVVLFLRKASREHESLTSETGDVIFDQEKCMFLSHVLAVRLGRTLEIKNSDPIAHNTNYSRSGMRGAPFNGTIPDGKMVAFQPTAEENQPVDVSCSIHPWMKAYILPRANGYFAVTAADGSFTIENLPAGEKLEFQVWHESASGTAGALVATAPDVDWGKNGRFAVKLTENETVTLPVVVPAGSFN